MLSDKNSFETDRLILKPIVMTDIDHLSPIYQNLNVMKYIYDGSIFSKEEAESRVRGFAKHWQNHGFGMWLFQMKSDNSVIGYGGFRYFEDERPVFKQQIELGYILNEPYWSMGFASEAVNQAVQLGLNQYGINRILATILPDNISSQKVVIKAGLEHTFDADFDGLLHQVYEINKP